MSKSPTSAHDTKLERRDLLKAVAVPMAGLMATARNATAQDGSDPPVNDERSRQPYDPQQMNPYTLRHIPGLAHFVPDKKFVWADLRAFDNTGPGLGVQEYLGRLPFKPDALFLLLSNPDFVFLYSNAAPTRPLEHRFVVYGGSTLPAQNWTTLQLRDFIAEMHKAGVKVLMSLFMLTAYGKSGGTDWFDSYPEVLTITLHACRSYFFCVYKMKTSNGIR